MVVRMNWMILARKWIILLMIFCLLGTVTQACHDYEEEQKCYEETKEETIESLQVSWIAQLLRQPSCELRQRLGVDGDDVTRPWLGDSSVSVWTSRVPDVGLVHAAQS